MGSRLIAWEFASGALFFRHTDSSKDARFVPSSLPVIVLGDQAILFGLKMLAKLNVAGGGLPRQLLI